MKGLCFMVLLCLGMQAAAQQPKFRNEYYDTKRALQESIPKVDNAIVMLGNSLTEQGSWAEYFPGKDVLNRGIGGDIIAGMVDRLPDILDNKPAKIFITAGVNDILFFDITNEEFEAGYAQIFEIIRKESPASEIFLGGLLPVNDTVKPDSEFLENKNGKIAAFNELVKHIAVEYRATYIDIRPHMLNGEQLNANYTTDGIHLNEKGYLIWAKVLKPYIYDRGIN